MRFGRVVILAALLAGGPLVLTTAATATQATTGPDAGQLIQRRDASGAASAAPKAGPSAARVAMSLGVVLALIVLLFLAGRRFVPRGMLAQSAGGAVQVLSRTAIGPKQRIVLLQVGRRILIVADDGQRLGTLSEITDADEAAALIAQLQSERADGSFSAALSGAMERFRAAQDAPADTPDAPEQPGLDAMRHEIEGLAQRVRGMAR